MRQYVTINDREYEVPEVDFDAICQLEEKGVYLLNFDRNERKIGMMIRGLAAWVMDTDEQTASREISEHIRKGGNVMEIANVVVEAVTESGFFGRNQSQEKVQQIPQNREQRRAQNHSKNRNHTSR